MTTDTPRRCLIAYDIPDDRRRLRLANLLSAHGDRVQYSVFVADARPARLIRLRSAIEKLIDTQTDSILICDLGPVQEAIQRRMETIGRARPLTGQGPLIV